MSTSYKREQEYTFISDKFEHVPFAGMQIYVVNGEYPKKGVPTPAEPDKRIFVKHGGLEAIKREQEYTFLLDKVEYVPFTGVQIYVVDGEYPKKGFPTPEAVFAINIVKTLTLELIRVAPFLILFGKNIVLGSYNKIANRSLDGYRINEIYLCKAAYSIYLSVFAILKDLGVKERIALNFANNIAHIFEYDDAWRYRMQDMVTECSLVNLKEKPIEEIKRLLGIYFDRDGGTFIRIKIKRFVSMLSLLLLIPKFKKAFVDNINLVNAKFDQADWYWVSQRNDYLFGGITYEERVSQIKEPKQVKIQL